jgi:ribosomal protein S18 acetylase RimI-like enzyme
MSIAIAMRSAHLFRIRPFHERDLDDAAMAANAACRQAYAYFGYNSPVSVSRDKLIEARDEGQQMFVPEIDGIVVGILTLKEHFIDKLFLAPEWHRQGIGMACLDHAKRIYPDRIDLHCAQQNFGACRLYERAGFRPIAYRIYKPIGVGDIVYRWTGA